MKKTNSSVGVCEPTCRITRSRASALQTSRGPVILKPQIDKNQELQPKQGRKSKVSLGSKNNAKKKAPFMDITNVSNQDINDRSQLPGTSFRKPARRTNRTAKTIIPVPETKPFASKRKAASEDVSDVAVKKVSTFFHESSLNDFICAAKLHPKRLQRFKIGLTKCNFAVTTRGKESVEEDTKEKINALVAIAKGNAMLGEISIKKEVFFQEFKEKDCSMYNGLKDEGEQQEIRKELCYIDIDLDHTNPQMCAEYAVDIYYSLRVLELDRRPITNFMETIQRDITQSMRSILIDWLVEVAEEYKLVPDSLHLAVHIIDQFLSHNYIERQMLQLLGITSMLIASKFEEICAPRIDEFCFITDNTYSAEDVKKMERQVVNSLNFQISVPTAKTFLRRFLRAAQASYKITTLVLEFLANYLVELTLIEYSFLKYIPSNVAASAVFLARWTIDQSSHPWNSTLEHYTCYKAPDLKAAVFAMYDLQKNSRNCPLHAIREKYRQLKFKSVANLSPQEPPPELFYDTCIPSPLIPDQSL